MARECELKTIPTTTPIDPLKEYKNILCTEEK